MQLIQQWPQDLRERHETLSMEARAHLARQDYQGAADAFSRAYQLVLEAQPEGHRYHKGESLHNKGLALLFAGQREGALLETLAAFVEDAASLAEESPQFEELDRPAAHNLIYVFGLVGPPLAQFAREVRAFIRSGRLLPDPHALLGTTPPPQAAIERTIGTFNQPPHRRVFIGGWYGRLNDTLRPLRDHLGGIGYDGVMAADFSIPSGWGEDEIERALLTNCHYAVFEVSESAGQIEEIAHVPETMRTPARVMAVFNREHGPTPGISKGQTLAKLERWGVIPQSYADIDELRVLVERWLASPT